MIFFGSIAFWATRSGDLASVLYYDMRTLCEYPITIYPRAISFLLTFILPWALINYYPSLILLDRADTVFQQLMGSVSPVIGIIAFIGAYRFFYYSLRHYESTGN